MVAAWPSTLPQAVDRSGYAEGFKKTVLRSAMSSGATKRRQRFTNSPTVLNVTMTMSDAQLAIFKTFYEDTLGNGALSFTFPHPRLATTVTVILVADPVPIKPEGAITYFVSMQLEIIP